MLNELDKQVVRALVKQELVLFDLTKNRSRLVSKSIEIRSAIDEKNDHIDLLGESLGSDVCRVDIKMLENSLNAVLDDIVITENKISRIKAHVI